MFSSSVLDLPTHVESAEMGFGKSLAFDATSTSFVGFLKHSLSIILDNQESKQIFYFLLLNLSYMFVQLAYGVWTNSLGLISDAIHMFFDCLALAVGLFASVMSKWPPNPKYSYGYNRIETISAYFNGVFLVLISVSIVVEAIERLIDPPEMNTQRLLLVSFVGLIVNLVGIFAFNHGHGHGHSHGGHDHHHHHGHDHGHGHSANMQGVFLHILADTLGSVGVIISTLLIQWFGWTGFDPIASMFIAILIVLSVIPLIRQSGAVLMLELDDHVVNQVEGTLNELTQQIKGVIAVNQPRFWPNEAETLVGSLHVQAHDDVDLQDIRRRVSELLMSHIDGLKEVCVQVETESAARSRLKAHHQHQTKSGSGFFYGNSPAVSSPSFHQHHHNHSGATTATAVNGGINQQMNFRMTMPPQPNVAAMSAANNGSGGVGGTSPADPSPIPSYHHQPYAPPPHGTASTAPAPPPSSSPVPSLMKKQTKKE
ncbi:cation efflux family-domain-containing protein [Zychaea mexicana]|uniref:cation efflux family-domain-containing protein n=1 Tax=Zychaea mexicana TaxID=64656 RepID=UPI0022FE13B0|nr:cation efflux family-domain-containing protein [Zychaea mexicana]KAI9494011.1 cation efflux family-domain-containing protein [Zychaea mexicana]